MTSQEPTNTENSPSENEEALARVTVIIPALNEAASIGLVLNDLPTVGQILVVDNGSTDKTADVARAAGATVISEPERGYGAACLRGILAIEEEIENGTAAPEIVAFVDADYSDHVDLLPSLLQPIWDQKAEFVLGSRLLGERELGAMPPQSVYGNKLACFLMRLFFGAKFTDLGPFRTIRFDALKRLGMVDRNYGWTIEMQIKASRAGVSWIEVPVPYRRRIGSSKISGTISGTIKAGTKILFSVAKYGFFRINTRIYTDVERDKVAA